MVLFKMGRIKLILQSNSNQLDIIYSTSIVISVSILGLDKKVLMNKGDFHAEGDSKLFLKGVPPKLKTNKKLLKKCT
jgi:hypothetical protein